MITQFLIRLFSGVTTIILYLLGATIIIDKIDDVIISTVFFVFYGLAFAHTVTKKGD